MESRKQPIGFLVKQINNVFEKDLNGRLKAIGVTSSQCAVLDYLFHTNKEEVSQRDVEQNLNLKNPTVTGLLKRLDEKGYILCVPNAEDKRRKNIYLTEKAYDIQRRMDTDRKKLDKRLTRGMTKKEVAAVTRALEKMLYNIADP
ncbi:MAG: MarR family transcriptional regulator [Ruminococcus sp.]|nr:MarR family transcriptional regulator [Ruminococcus sp.]